MYLKIVFFLPLDTHLVFSGMDTLIRLTRTTDLSTFLISSLSYAHQPDLSQQKTFIFSARQIVVNYSCMYAVRVTYFKHLITWHSSQVITHYSNDQCAKCRIKVFQAMSQFTVVIDKKKYNQVITDQCDKLSLYVKVYFLLPPSPAGFFPLE